MHDPLLNETSGTRLGKEGLNKPNVLLVKMKSAPLLQMFNLGLSQPKITSRSAGFL